MLTFSLIMSRPRSPTLEEIKEHLNVESFSEDLFAKFGDLLSEDLEFPDFLCEEEDSPGEHNNESGTDEEFDVKDFEQLSLIDPVDNLSDEDIINRLSQTFNLNSKNFKGLERWKLEYLYKQNILQ